MKTIFLLTLLSAFYEYCESPRAKRTRQSRDWVLNETKLSSETNMATLATVYQTERVCSKLDQK